MCISRAKPALAIMMVASSISRLCVAASRRKRMAAANNSGNRINDSIGVKMKARSKAVGRGFPKTTM